MLSGKLVLFEDAEWGRGESIIMALDLRDGENGSRVLRE